MKRYLVTFGYEDGEPKQIWIEASGKFHAALILKRWYGNQLYVREIEEFRVFDEEYCEGQHMVKIPMTDEEVKKRIKEAIKNGKSNIKEAAIKNDEEMLLHICKRLKNICIDVTNAENDWRDEEPGSKLPELEDVLEELEEYLDVKDTLYWSDIDE
jgi:hypothetical protein